MTLTLEHVTGGYGNLQVLKDLNFTVADGSIVGLIGLNGAGKSTTIKHIIGLLTPQQGKITIDDKTLAEDPDGYRQAIAYVPETPVLYAKLTLREHLELTMMAYALDKDAAWAKANEMLKKFRLDNKLDWFPAKFSKGMKQKVMIVAAFMTNAKLYIIDEPFTGLDPLAVHDLLDLVQAKKSGGRVCADVHAHFGYRSAVRRPVCAAAQWPSPGHRQHGAAAAGLQACRRRQPGCDLHGHDGGTLMRKLWQGA